MIPSILVRWDKWLKIHPDTLVLSKKTGFNRDYSRDPYRSYHKNPFAFFDFPAIKKGLKAKELVFGVQVGETKKAYPLKILKKMSAPLHDDIGGLDIIIIYDNEGGGVQIEGDLGVDAVTLLTYWFAWNSFHPDTAVYGGSSVEEGR